MGGYSPDILLLKKKKKRGYSGDICRKPNTHTTKARGLTKLTTINAEFSDQLCSNRILRLKMNASEQSDA